MGELIAVLFIGVVVAVVVVLGFLYAEGIFPPFPAVDPETLHDECDESCTLKRKDKNG